MSRKVLEGSRHKLITGIGGKRGPQGLSSSSMLAILEQSRILFVNPLISPARLAFA